MNDFARPRARGPDDRTRVRTREPTRRRTGRADVFDSVTEWVTDVVDALGYLGVAFLVTIENLFPPIPSEVVLPLAGFVAGQGRANVIGTVAAATAGSVVGAWALYATSAATTNSSSHRPGHVRSRTSPRRQRSPPRSGGTTSGA